MSLMSNKTIINWGYACKIITIVSEVIIAILSILREFLSSNEKYKILNSKEVFWTIIVIIVIAGICQVIVLFIGNEVAKRLKKVTEENSELIKENEQIYLLKNNIGLMLKTFLREIAHNLDFSTDDRISLYIILDSNFALCGRVSNNPEFEKIGRSSYPLNEGVIGLAWQNKIHFDDKIPPFSDKNQKYQTYHQKEYGIPSIVSQNFSMKSILYYGYRINDYDNSDPVGVIIIESIKKQRFKEDDLLKALENIDLLLYKLIKTFHEHIPALKRAQQEEGF